MTSSPPLLERLASPPIIVTNPEVIKYLICQLFTEAILVLTLVILVPSILWEEYRHYSKSRSRKKKNKDQKEEQQGQRQGGDDEKSKAADKQQQKVQLQGGGGKDNGCGGGNADCSKELMEAMNRGSESSSTK